MAGKNAATIERAVKDAFEHPFALDETIRLTFVTGAGKLGRQKYDDNAAKAVTGPLKDLGYEDDAGGGPGTYKLQHDTGKNLKTVVVYPKVQGGDGADGAADGMGKLSVGGGGESLVAEGTPEHKIAFASVNVFEKMVTSMCPSWSQKKGCMKAIEDLNATIQRLDEKLMTGTPLSDPEQDFYDSVSSKSLADKASKVRDLMHGQVEKGELTLSEKAFLLEQVSDRIDNLQKDLVEAEKANKAKRVEALATNLAKANDRKEMLSKITPKRPHALKNDGEIAKLRKELAPLLQLEASAKGRLLSIKETQSLARKEQIESEIAELEVRVFVVVFVVVRCVFLSVASSFMCSSTITQQHNITSLQESSRGWFESDEDFAARVQVSRVSTKPSTATSSKKSAPAKPAAAAAAAGKGASWVTPGASAWGTAGAKHKTGPKTATAKAAGKSGGGGGVFAAMMMDSDSD